MAGLEEHLLCGAAQQQGLQHLLQQHLVALIVRSRGLAIGLGSALNN